MRYIGNKTKLLPFIDDLLDGLGLRPRRAFDAFSGTAAVGSFLKARGARVVSCDLMTFSYAFQRAYIVTDRYPAFEGLMDDPDLRAARARAEFAHRVDARVREREAAGEGRGARAHGARDAGRRADGRSGTGRVRAAAAAGDAATRGNAAATRRLDEILVFLDSYLDPHTSFISQHFAAALAPAERPTCETHSTHSTHSTQETREAQATHGAQATHALNPTHATAQTRTGQTRTTDTRGTALVTSSTQATSTAHTGCASGARSGDPGDLDAGDDGRARHGGAGTLTRPSARGSGATDVPPVARMYFTLDCARRIDAVRERLHEWQSAGAITDEEFYLLLAALVEAADAVANTTGIYAAYIKQWQPNALRPLRLRLPVIVPPADVGPDADDRARADEARCVAHLGDVSAIAPRAGRFDLLYLDPPYNSRQYNAYYHVPELIARGWFGAPVALRGKTGLPPVTDTRSVWSTRGGCVPALEQLIASVDTDHVVLSYNSEGIIPEAEIERILRAAGRPRTFRRITREYQRYRSDRPSATRRYTAHSVSEHLYYVRLAGR